MSIVSTRGNRFGAFTLIELLVVMSIISLLVALLLPALGKSRDSAHKIQCATNLRGIGTTLFSYCADNNELIPLISTSGNQGQWPVYQPGAANNSDFHRMLTGWGNITYPTVPGSGWYSSSTVQIPSPRPLICPSAPQTTGGWNTPNDFTQFLSRYSWFANTYGSGNMSFDSFASTRPFPKFRMQNLETLQNWQKNPVIIAMDRIDAINNNGTMFGANYGTVTGAGQYWMKTNHWIDSSTDTRGYDGANIVRLDGSVNWYAWGSGGEWFTGSNHARPYKTTFFTSWLGWGQITTNDGTGANQYSTNAGNNMDPSNAAGFGGTYASQYALFKRALGYH